MNTKLARFIVPLTETALTLFKVPAAPYNSKAHETYNG
jgi:hypothetical protein